MEESLLSAQLALVHFSSCAVGGAGDSNSSGSSGFGSSASSSNRCSPVQEQSAVHPIFDLREFYVGLAPAPVSYSSSEAEAADNLEETYTSSLFQTEPLYQFYDRQLSVTDSVSLNYVRLYGKPTEYPNMNALPKQNH
jgi:hypothetical protein